MHISVAAQVVLLTAATACALPATVTKPYWTIQDTHRKCSGDTCTWTVTVDRHTGEELITCDLPVKNNDSTSKMVYCGALFGDTRWGKDGVDLHLYEHRSDHIDHVMGELKVSQVEGGKVAPDMNWDIFTTSTI